MAKKDLAVFRIEYERLPKLDMWAAHVMAFSHEEALLYLRRRVGPHRVISSGIVCKVDALSEEVRYHIVNKTIGKPKVEKTAEIEKKIDEEVAAEAEATDTTDKSEKIKKATFKRK